MIHEFYRSFFNQAGRDTPIEPWDGEPRPLENPITAAEVQEAVQKLNNGRAYGKDGTPGVLYRYGGPKLCEHLAIIYNQMFEQEKYRRDRRGHSYHAQQIKWITTNRQQYTINHTT